MLYIFIYLHTSYMWFLPVFPPRPHPDQHYHAINENSAVIYGPKCEYADPNENFDIHILNHFFHWKSKKTLLGICFFQHLGHQLYFFYFFFLWYTSVIIGYEWESLPLGEWKWHRTIFCDSKHKKHNVE